MVNVRRLGVTRWSSVVPGYRDGREEVVLLSAIFGTAADVTQQSCAGSGEWDGLYGH